MAGVKALFASFATHELPAFVSLVMEHFQILGRWIVLGSTVLTDRSDQPLGDDSNQRGRDLVGCDPHVQQPGHRAGTIVRVQSAQDQVSRQGRLNRHLGGLAVTDFADHDHVRVLP